MRNIKLFNRDGAGSEEITASLGLIASGISFEKWEAVLPFGIREVGAIIGTEPLDALADFYESGEMPTDELPAACTIPLGYLKQAVALFTWLRIIPTLDAQHDDAGRSRRLGENEKGLTALQEWKDEQNILRMAYDAIDALIEALDRGQFPFWVNSKKYKVRESLLIRSKEEFDEYYHIGSHRLFFTLLPMIREVQALEVAPVVGANLLSALLSGAPEVEALQEPACRALALLTIKKAVERLPIEVIPEGVVQLNQSQPVNGRASAQQQARTAVAASLKEDADRWLAVLGNLAAEMQESAAPVKDVESYVSTPIVHSKGMTF